MNLLAFTFSEQIKSVARRLGFARVGITTPESPEYPHYAAAIAAGRHAEMAYLARDDAMAKRRDPRRILPGARSIVCVALSYWTGEEPPPTRASGRIARYARGDDYHEVLLARLQDLAAEIEAMGGEAKAYTDTGPIMEVSHAVRAGLGWRGKNGLLLSEQGGTWFLLGEVLTTLELTPDEPVTPRCGSCTRCLDACPTDAFPAPYEVDANRCISYLTIENKGAIPEGLREGHGRWVFGCDVCQEVCPWSIKFPTPTGDRSVHSSPIDLSPRDELAAPDLIELLALDDESFRERFRGSPIKRAKRRGLLRNVAVGLGNLRDPDSVPALAEALSDPSPLVREHVAWALGRIGDKAARAALREALERETEPTVAAAIRAALPDS